jgi:hypothetical protein
MKLQLVHHILVTSVIFTLFSHGLKQRTSHPIRTIYKELYYRYWKMPKVDYLNLIIYILLIVLEEL